MQPKSSDIELGTLIPITHGGQNWTAIETEV